MQPKQAITYLQSQTISADGPGTILRDFQTALDFVAAGEAAISAKSGHFTGPATVALDQRLAQQLPHGLKRVSFVSRPNVQGLYSLLLGSGLAYRDGKRLRLNDAVYRVWSGFNPAERYFNLLEAWVTRAIRVPVNPHLDGRPDWGFSDWLDQLARGRPSRRPDAMESMKFRPGYHILAVAEQFGLCVVEAKPAAAGPWVPRALRTTRFGQAVMALLNAWLYETALPLWFERPPGRPLGELQSVFQPLFPDWRENLTPSGVPGPRGVCTLTVTLDDAWRRIAVAAHLDLDNLALGILALFGIEDAEDESYTFVYRDARGEPVEVASPGRLEGLSSDVTRLTDLPLRPGDTIELEYGYWDARGFVIRFDEQAPDAPESGAETVRLLARGDKPTLR